MCEQYRPRTIFGRLAALSIGHRRWVLGLVGLLTLLAGLAASTLTVNSNTLELLPKDEPSTLALHELNELEGGVTTLSITVGGGSEEGRHAWLDEVAERLEALPEIQYTYHQMSPDLVWRVGLLQLRPAELREIRDRLKGAVALGPAVMNPFVAQRLLDLGPLTERILTASYQARLSPAEGQSRLIVRPTGQPTDLPFARKVMASVEQVLAETEPPEPQIQVLWVGGGYRHNVEDYEGVVHDLKWTSVAALAMVFMVIAAAFRDPRAVVLVFVPLLVANIWTLGFARLAVGYLNTFTSFISAVLLGLGVDFGIHLFSRYREERASGIGIEEAIYRAWDRVGPPAMSTAITASIGFLALLVARFRGFSQLGLLLGVGVLLCLVLVFVLLPLLIMWRERKPRVTARSPAPRSLVRATYRLAPVGLILALLVTAAAALQVPRLGFQHDLSELRRVGMSYSDMDPVEQRLARDSYSPLVVSYPDAAALEAAHVEIQEDIEEGRFPEISLVLSIHTVIPPDQDQRLAVLEEIGELARNDAARYLPGPIQQNLAPLTRGELEPLTIDDLPRSLLHILGGGPDRHRLLLIPSGNMWDLRETSHLNATISERFPDVSVAGEYLALGSLYDTMKSDAPRIIGLALLLVFGATLLDLRRLGPALGAVGVLLGGMAWAAAALAILRIDLSIVNIVGVPILLGLGIATVIHLLHRLMEEGPGRIQHALATTGWAAALCITTTVASFAALSFADSQGVRSLGLLVMVGLVAVTIGAFVLLPLGWATVLRADEGRAGTGEDEPGSEPPAPGSPTGRVAAP